MGLIHPSDDVCVYVSSTQVSTINPGFHRTEINHNASETLRVAFEKAPKEVQAEYGEEYLQVRLELVEVKCL